MKINIIKAYMVKEFKELFRSRLIIMVYLLPSMILLLFGYGIKLNVTHARILILDNDQSKLSLELASKFEHTKYFNAKYLHINKEQALKMIKEADEDAILIIPASFEKNLLKGEKSELGVFVDASFPVRGTTIQSYIQGTIISAVQQMTN